MKATIVSAYYEIPSKFPTTQYWTWIQNFCEIPFDLVLFTSPNLVEKFQTLRSMHKNTVVIPLKFEELYHYRFYEKYNHHLNTLDFNKKHSPELYIIWAEKLKFVMRAIKLNPFNTDKFLWCDIGAFRQPQFQAKFQTFPQYDKIVPHKMNFLLLRPFSRENLIPKNGLVGQTYGEVRMGGGIHGGTVDAWEKYEKLWDETLQRYFDNNKFAGQDQCIMGTIFLENEYPDGLSDNPKGLSNDPKGNQPNYLKGNEYSPNDPDGDRSSRLFNIIIPQNYGGDPWFYLLYHWS